MFIEKYRGFEISLSTRSGLFSCSLTNNTEYNDEKYEKECKSLVGIKNFIDLYRKNNTNFESFKIQNHPNIRHEKQLDYTVTGIRKDEKFVMLNSSNNNRKVSISTYSENNYIVVDPDNEKLYSELFKLDEKFNEIEKQYKQDVEDVISKFNIVTLKDKKEELIK